MAGDRGCRRRYSTYRIVLLAAGCNYYESTVAFGDDGDDEHKRVSEHRQRDCHQLRGVQHHAAANEDNYAEPRRSTDDRSTP